MGADGEGSASPEQTLRLSIEHEPSPDDIATIGRNLYEFNRRHGGYDHHRLLAVFLRDEDGQIVAGSTGSTFWGWLVIDLLWVREDLRGRGIGGRLLETAEAEATRRGCVGAFLDTLDFQAPAFYQKRGYRVFGELPGIPPGHVRYYLAKRFDAGGRAMDDGGGRKRPLKVGIMLPESEREMAGDTARWSDYLAMARTTEELGFDSLWFADHLYMKVPGHEPQGAWEAWSMLAALAATTTRLELAPFVTCTGYRNPALIAKIAETVDEISGGRLVLGLGAGWAEPEYRAFGFPFDHRASRFEEALQIITSLIRTGCVDFKGEYYSAEECELRPRGPRPNGMPIMIGTFHGERMMRLTARYADQWNVWAQWTGNRASQIPALREKMDAICREVGRDPATLERSAAVMVDFPGAYGRPGQTVPSLTGSAEELAEEFRAYARAGIAHLQLYPDPCTVAGIEALAPVLELLDRG